MLCFNAAIPWSCKKLNTCVDFNRKAQPLDPFISEIFTGQGCCTIQQENSEVPPTQPSCQRKRHVNTQEGDGAPPSMGSSLNGIGLTEALQKRPGTQLSPNLPLWNPNFVSPGASLTIFSLGLVEKTVSRHLSLLKLLTRESWDDCEISSRTYIC